LEINPRASQSHMVITEMVDPPWRSGNGQPRTCTLAADSEQELARRYQRCLDRLSFELRRAAA